MTLPNTELPGCLCDSAALTYARINRTATTPSASSSQLQPAANTSIAKSPQEKRRESQSSDTVPSCLLRLDALSKAARHLAWILPSWPSSPKLNTHHVMEKRTTRQVRLYITTISQSTAYCFLVWGVQRRLQPGLRFSDPKLSATGRNARRRSETFTSPKTCRSEMLTES